MTFPKKFVWGKWTILGPKIAHPDNSGSTPRIFKKFFAMKGANRYIETILMAFPKKFLFGANEPFRTQNGASLRLWIHYKDCITILHNERGQEKHGNYIRDNFVILAQKWYALISLDLLSGIFLILYNKRCQEIQSFLLVVFREKILFGAI